MSEDRIFFAPDQQITLPGPPQAQWTLDIGGGGEGIMGQWLGHGVVAVDPLESELREAPPGPLKMVMDGSRTPFLGESFDLVTMFFVMMYVPPDKREKIWREAFRVLKPGGRVLMWGLNIPPHDGVHDLYAVKLTVSHPGGVIKTGYGMHWKGRRQEARMHRQWAVGAGFDIQKDENNGVVFHLQAAKGGAV